MEENLRIVEIIEGCMGGDSGLYLTDAPKEAIVEACRLYREDDEPIAFKEYFFRPVLTTLDYTSDYYKAAKKNFIISETYDIYERG